MPAPAIVFYDGHCGLCHGFVRFLLARDVAGTAFRFAPLESDAFRAAVSAPERASLPDSIVVRTADGRILCRSAAVLHVLDRLGGGWSAVARVMRVVPRGLLDRGYDAVAAVRHRLFAPPPAACPLLPPELRERFMP